jgi:arsenate reductase
MAEGYLRQHVGERFHIHSAGMEPKEEVHPLAVRVMQEDGIDISSHRPSHVKEFLGRMQVRYLIIVCDGANASCPRIFPGLLERLYWPFEDPAAFEGTPDATLTEFRRIRDQIKSRIAEWAATLEAVTAPSV